MGRFWAVLVSCLCLAGCGRGETSPPDTALAAVVGLVKSRGLSAPVQCADFVREFVHRNSVHLIDDEYYTYAHDTPRILALLLARSRGRGEPPHLDCYTRSRAMEAILGALGIETRAVDVYSDDFDHPASHSFLEVYDPGARAWHVQDPDYNLHYLDSAGGAQLSALELVFRPLDRALPCRDGSVRGWEKLGVELLRDHYFELLVYDRRRMEKAKTVILVNLSRFSLEKRFPEKENATLPQFAERFYNRPVIITNNGFGSAVSGGG